MPTNNWDAVITSLYPVDFNTKTPADTVEAGKEFDIVADIEVGPEINAFAVRDTLSVAVRNLSQSTIAFTKAQTRTLTPAQSRRTEQLTVKVPANWPVNSGDLLEIVATYRFEAGVYTDHSSLRSATFIVV